MDKIQYSLNQSSLGMDGPGCGDTLFLTFTVPGSNQATKASIESDGKEAKYTCQVSVDDHKAGNNPMGSSPSVSTKSIYGQNSTNAIPCNFLRLDENYDADHTALYTFPTYNHATVLEGEVNGSPEGSSLLRSITLKPEQKYNFYSQQYSGDLRDSIFYHTRLVGWHPVVCKLPASGTPVEFGDNRYSNYLALIGNKYGIVFDHALDGGTDIMISNLGQAQRWHSNGAPASGKRDNRYRDLAKQIPDTNYCYPFGYNQDQQPHYSNPMYFKHFLSAVRIWAKVSQESESTLNLSTWGKILSLSFVDQPSTCTVLFPETVGNDSFGTLLEDSWTNYTNHRAQCGLIYGEGDITLPDGLEDGEVKYPIDMTQAQAEMSKKYLGYCLVMPGQDITIAIQTSAGTYQAVLPHRVLLDGKADSTSIFQGGMIYDVVLNLETKGSVSEFIEHEDTGYYEDLSPYDDVNEEFKTANCYIIDVNHIKNLLSSQEQIPGFCFSGTILGNGETGILSRGTSNFHTSTATIETPASAKLVWQSEVGLVSNIHLQHGYIRFNTPSSKKGNAVIAALDKDGNVVWSWHIWITDTPQIVESSQNYEYMDRNLGAITTTDGVVVPTTDEEALKLFGLYYQWGRKDPMPGPLKYDQSKGQTMRITPVYDTYNNEITSLGMYIYNQAETIVDGIEKPMHYLINQTSPYYNFNWMAQKIDFLWGEEETSASGDVYYHKSIYDPCPTGYHVPCEEIQYLAETATSRAVSKYGLTMDGVFLPFAGYYGPDRNQTANDGGAYYCGTKGDYQSSVICSDEDGMNYPYFRNHRLRTYVSYSPAWAEQNIDGKTLFPYNAPDNYVFTDVIKTGRDFTNRRTAASVRCVKEKNYELNVVSSLYSNTLKLFKEKNTQVVFSFKGRTNKGSITSALLRLYYYRNTDNQKVTIMDQDLSTVGTAILTSKTLTGTSEVTIYGSDVMSAKDETIYARLDITVKQGTTEHVEESDLVILADGATLDIEMDEEGTSANLIDAYVPADNEIRLIRHNNTYAPVVGQSVVLTVYVNAPDATVTIEGKEASVIGDDPQTIGTKGLYYPYSATVDGWTSSSTKSVTVTASKTSYKDVTRKISVPVYGIDRGSEHTDLGNFSTVTLSNGVYRNWYIIRANWSGVRLFYTGNAGERNGKISAQEHSDVTHAELFGFESSGPTSRIIVAKAGRESYVDGSTRQANLSVSATGQSYTVEKYHYGVTYKNYRQISIGDLRWTYSSLSSDKTVYLVKEAGIPAQLNIYKAEFKLNGN